MKDSNGLKMKNIHDESEETTISHLISSVLTIYDKQPDSLWSKLYANTLPPALCNLNLNVKPRFYRTYPISS